MIQSIHDEREYLVTTNPVPTYPYRGIYEVADCSQVKVSTVRTVHGGVSGTL